MIYKDTLYKRLIQSTRWVRLRNSYIKEHPMCERCGHLATEVHHRTPIMRFRNDPQRMEQECFNPDNLMSVCQDCHVELHKELGKYSHQKQHAKELHEEQVQDFMNRYLN